MSTTDITGLAGWIDVLRAARAERKRIDEVITQAEDRIKDALGDVEDGLVNGQPAVRWTYVTSTRLDQKLAKSLLTPDQLAACMTETRSRRFTLVDPEDAA